LQDIRTLSENIKLISTRCETGQKSSSRVRFLQPVSKTGTNKCYICR